MKRAFYTDPLAAAWMAKHFGMKFVAAKEVQQIHIICENPYVIENSHSPYFFHLDSLALLEPRYGDEDENGFVFNAKLQVWERECGRDDSGEILWEARLPAEETRTARRNDLSSCGPNSRRFFDIRS